MSVKLASVFFFEDGWTDFMNIIQIIPEWFKSCFGFTTPEQYAERKLMTVEAKSCLSEVAEIANLFSGAFQAETMEQFATKMFAVAVHSAKAFSSCFAN